MYSKNYLRLRKKIHSKSNNDMWFVALAIVISLGVVGCILVQQDESVAVSDVDDIAASIDIIEK